MDAYIEFKFPKTDAITRQRITFLKNLATLIPGHSDFSFLNETKKVLAEVHTTDNVDTQWNRLMHVVMAMKADPSSITEAAKSIYDDAIKKIKAEREAKRNNNVRTPKQEKTLETELHQRQEELTEKTATLFAQYQLPYKVLTAAKFRSIDVFKFAKALQDLVVSAAYLFQPALRNDWGGLNITYKMTGLSTEKNYLYVRGSTMRIIMNVYKNAKSMGHQIIEVRPKLVELLIIWLSVLKHLLGNKPSHPLYYTITNTKCDFIENDEALRRNIPRITQRVFDVKDANGNPIGLSINDFRHLWEVAIQVDPFYAKLSEEARKKIHAELLHSTSMAQLYNVH